MVNITYIIYTLISIIWFSISVLASYKGDVMEGKVFMIGFVLLGAILAMWNDIKESL